MYNPCGVCNFGGFCETECVFGKLKEDYQQLEHDFDHQDKNCDQIKQSFENLMKDFKKLDKK